MSSISRFDHDTIVEPMKARIAELEAKLHSDSLLVAHIKELEAEVKRLRELLDQRHRKADRQAEEIEILQAKNDALREAMAGWQGYCTRNGVYVDDVQEFFDEVLKEQAKD